MIDHKLTLGKIRAVRYEILLFLLIAVYVFYLSFLSINRYLTMGSHYFDLGIMNQVVANTADGNFLQMTNQDLERNASRISIHFDPILGALAPLYWIYRGPEVLLVAQTIIMALGGVAVYLIARHILTSRAVSTLFTLSYLTFYPTLRANLFDVHAVTFATTFLLFALYFGLVRRHRLSFLFIILALLCKENVGLVTFFYGIYQVIFRREYKFGLLIVLVSAIFFIGTVFYLIPLFRGSEHFGLKYFDDLSVQTFFTRLYTGENLNYVRTLLSVHFLFILFAPLEFLIAIPELGLNILSNNSNMKHFYFHYNALIVPFVYFSAIQGYYTFTVIMKKKLVQYFILLLFVVLSAANSYLYSPFPPQLVKHPHRPSQVDIQKLEVVRNLQDRFRDPTIVLSTSPKLAPFFSARRTYYNFLFDPSFATYGYTRSEVIGHIDRYTHANYVIIDRSEFEGQKPGDLPALFYQHLRLNQQFHLISQDAEIEVYEHRRPL